jgi:peptidoglycan lytic transglycosylase
MVGVMLGALYSGRMFIHEPMKQYLLIALFAFPILAVAGEVASGPPESRASDSAALADIAPASPAPVLRVASAADDEDFIKAHDAFNAGNADRIKRLAPHFSSSLLEPYIAYYGLQLDLENADAADIRQFLARPQDTPLIDRLRGEWLKLLGKNRQWDAFMEEYPRLVNPDDELVCYALQARLRDEKVAALEEGRTLWFSGEELPDNCEPLFDAAIAAGVITQEDIWQRFRLALEAGNITLAGRLAAKLAPELAPDPVDLRHAYRNPSHYLASLRLADASMAKRVVALFALQRLAMHSTQQAFAQWKKIAAYFPEEEQRYFYGWLGYEGARAHDDRALQWYREAGVASLTAPQLAWRARAALRATDWREVLTSINSMGPEQQSEYAWRYWKARALQAMGLPDAAQSIFIELSRDYGYYGLLAADELDEASRSAAQTTSHLPEQAEIDAVLAQPGIRRALALYRMGLEGEASAEWDWAVRNYNDRQLLAAAEVARRNKIYDRAIDTAERTEQLHDFSLRYPTPYRAELEQHIRENDLNEAWVYGLMRQESRFAMHANSNVGAAGLMQIMPATAHWAARRLGLKNYRKARIHDLGTNLKLGTYYLRTVLSRFDNNPVLAFAAYNAGPTRAQQWRGDVPLEGAIYIETIPFSETRHYVRKVMGNIVYYSRLFGQPAASLKQRLGVIEPDKAASHVATADQF